MAMPAFNDLNGRTAGLEACPSSILPRMTRQEA